MVEASINTVKQYTACKIRALEHVMSQVLSFYRTRFPFLKVDDTFLNGVGDIGGGEGKWCHIHSVTLKKLTETQFG